MVKSTNIPFYLDSVQPNIITENEIDHFVLTNPTLAKFIHNNLIELRLISLTTFEAFCYWIIGQQISGNAANAISIRFKKLLQSVNPDNTLIQNVDILKKWVSPVLKQIMF